MPTEALEEGGGADDAVGEARGLHGHALELGLELELCALELKKGFLDANGGEKDEVGGAEAAAGEEGVYRGLVVDGPGVLDAAGATSEAADDDVDGGKREVIEGEVEGGEVSDLGEADGGAGEKLEGLIGVVEATGAASAASDGDDVEAPGGELPDDELANVSCGAGDEDGGLRWRLGAEGRERRGS